MGVTPNDSGITRNDSGVDDRIGVYEEYKDADISIVNSIHGELVSLGFKKKDSSERWSLFESSKGEFVSIYSENSPTKFSVFLGVAKPATTYWEIRLSLFKSLHGIERSLGIRSK
jgi:hypothetical protein